jgi:type IV secretion system protein VirD4
VHSLDPFGVSGRPTAHYNPLNRMDASDIDLVDDVAAHADAIVQDDDAGGDATHWNEDARALIAGVILHIVATEPLERRSLLTLRDFFTLAPAGLSGLLEAMQGNPAVYGLVARVANRFFGKADREASGVLSVAQRHTHSLDSPRIADCVAMSDFGFVDLREGAVMIFLCLPPDRIYTYSRWLRLIVVEALTALTRNPALSGHKPVLFLFDEFAALGWLEPIAVPWV